MNDRLYGVVSFLIQVLHQPEEQSDVGDEVDPELNSNWIARFREVLVCFSFSISSFEQVDTLLAGHGCHQITA